MIDLPASSDGRERDERQQEREQRGERGAEAANLTDDRGSEYPQVPLADNESLKMAEGGGSDGAREAEAFDEVLDHVGHLLSASTPSTSLASDPPGSGPPARLMDPEADTSIAAHAARRRERVRT